MSSYSLYEGSPVFGDLMGLAPHVECGVYGGQDEALSKARSTQLIQGYEESSSLQNGKCSYFLLVLHEIHETCHSLAFYLIK